MPPVCRRSAPVSGLRGLIRRQSFEELHFRSRTQRLPTNAGYDRLQSRALPCDSACSVIEGLSAADGLGVRATRSPRPEVGTTRPAWRSSWTARLTVVRATPHCSASFVSVGRRSPQRSSPEVIACRSILAICSNGGEPFLRSTSRRVRHFLLSCTTPPPGRGSVSARIRGRRRGLGHAGRRGRPGGSGGRSGTSDADR